MFDIYLSTSMNSSSLVLPHLGILTLNAVLRDTIMKSFGYLDRERRAERPQS